MFKILRSCQYHTRKPRIYSQNDLAVQKYRRDLTKARCKITQEAHEYQDQIENQFIQQNKRKMAQIHHENQCQFRKAVIMSSFNLQQNILKWKKRDEIIQQRFEKYVRTQQLKRINRDRIRKILEYQSSNYWYNAQNVDQRLTSDMVFPEFLNSTEYYHKLQVEALAYQVHDFELLEKTHSNQQVIKQKNKLMIPLYKKIVAIIKSIKKNPFRELEFQKQIAIQKIIRQFDSDLQYLTEQDKAQRQVGKQKAMQEASKQYEIKIGNLRKQLSGQKQRKQILKTRLRNMIVLIRTWQNYTTVLGMSSAQIYYRLNDKKNSPQIKKGQQKILQGYAQNKNSSFVNLQQQDTEDSQISFNEFIQTIKKDESTFNGINIGKINKNNPDSVIDALVGDQTAIQKVVKEIEQKNKQQKKQKASFLNVDFDLFAELEFNLEQKDSKIQEHLKFNQDTTASIEFVKQQYQDDLQMKKLLNEIGQAKIYYQELFRKIWEIV